MVDVHQFFIGWLADYPDPHNWVYPFVTSTGAYAKRQMVVYGLDPGSMNWEGGYAPPYTSSIGGTVYSINGTYIDDLIDAGVRTPNGPARQAIYEELMDIYHAEASQLPLVAPKRREYTRIWINGWVGTFNENPIAPGRYYYTIWKALATAPSEVAVAAYSAELSPENNITTWLINHPIWEPQEGKPWMKTTQSGATNPMAILTGKIRRTDAVPGSVLVYVTWNGKTASGHNEEFGYTTLLMDPGDDLNFGPLNISDVAPHVGRYDLCINAYVLADNAVNTMVGGTQNFLSGYFYMLGYCDLNGDNVVDNKDYQLVKNAIPSVPGQAKWNWAADVNYSGSITVADYQIVKIHIPTVYTPA